MPEFFFFFWAVFPFNWGKSSIGEENFSFFFCLATYYVGTAASEQRGMQMYENKRRSDAGENYTNRVEKPANGNFYI